MSANKHQNTKTKVSKREELIARRLKIKKELVEIIERTEGQNRALGKIIFTKGQQTQL